ncbi:hypothetical protein JOC78_001122 [Bacillus ectoiniformans]|nr:hypothetical protein [Bacillus ectoiniformans]
MGLVAPRLGENRGGIIEVADRKPVTADRTMKAADSMSKSADRTPKSADSKVKYKKTLIKGHRFCLPLSKISTYQLIFTKFKQF